MKKLKSLSEVADGNTPTDVKEYFPFHVYFSNAPQPVFKGNCIVYCIVYTIHCVVYSIH